MIWLIAKKDFLSNIISARFIIGFILCLFLIPFSILINIGDYSDQMRLYQLDKAGAEKVFKEVRVYSRLRPEIVKPPEPLGVFSKGISDNVGNRVRIWLGEEPMLAEGKAATKDNPLLNAFFSINFVSIITIIISLLALIFSYDICTREKEEGTLRLQLSNSISRSRILMGKVLGIYLTLLPIMVFCYLLSAIIIFFSKNISFTALDWSRILLLFIASLLYLSVFVFIGLFISTRFKSSTTSIIVCLFFWVFFVFIVPNLSVYLAEGFTRLQSRDNLTRVMEELEKEYSQKTYDYYKTLDKPDWESVWYYSSVWDGGKEIYGASKSYMERERLRSIYSEPLRINYADKKWAYQKAYLQGLDHQRKVSDRISLVSPASIFQLIASAICYTDLKSHEKFMERARQYRETFIQFLKGKNLFSSFSYFTPVPPESFLTADEIVEKRSGGEFKTHMALEEWASKQQDWRSQFKKLSKVEIPGWTPEDYRYLNVSDVPLFQWPRKRLLLGLQSSILNTGLLIFESILLFYLCFVSFIRYDVR